LKHSCDDEITVEEVKSAMITLKFGESPGQDGLVGEMFKMGEDVLAPIIRDVFNVIFNNSFYPTVWSNSVVVSIPKTSDANDVNCYRGITLMSIFSKLFSLVLSK
jgi:hypothetical protein